MYREFYESESSIDLVDGWNDHPEAVPWFAPYEIGNAVTHFDGIPAHLRVEFITGTQVNDTIVIDVGVNVIDIYGEYVINYLEGIESFGVLCGVVMIAGSAVVVKSTPQGSFRRFVRSPRGNSYHARSMSDYDLREYTHQSIQNKRFGRVR